ncbi:bifunctional copper resistance protein CopD/cytochrome c oxidase assembly protein [Haloechinothrix sp. LS1_15]|nr:cytochrome c oxidase assembly protein [Haloechinothrix sp. LS1_15]MDV6011984.1 bifunctional copper resistance protein CopD/cytochrome c oxidase assembly protein [Haloechinothrix sp. LS1_15]
MEHTVTAARRPSSALPLIALATVLATLAAIGLAALAGVAGYAVAGIEGPGAVTGYGVIVTRLLATIAAVVCIGSLLLATFLVPPQRNWTVSADGYAALRTAGVAAWLWFTTAIAATLFSAADGGGRPVQEVLDVTVLVGLVDAVEQPKAWLVTAAIALVVAAGCRMVLSWQWTALLFGFSVAGLLPVAFTGHSATGGAHDLATDSLVLHIVPAALWVGGLVALVALGWRRSPHIGLAARRFSRVALACWIAMAISGTINALVRIGPADLLDTEYGLLLLAKIIALVMLGVLGQQQRSRGVRAVSERGDQRSLLQLGAIEVLIMFATLGVSTTLSRTPYPAQGTAEPGTAEVLIGYELDGPPTAARLLFDWRPDLIYGTLAIALAVLYLLGVRKLRQRGDAWPVGRTVAWLAGCASILIATSSGIGRYAPAMFSVHMGLHMLLSMVAPVLLVLGGAVTLALRAMRPAGRSRPPGPREWLHALVESRLSRVLTQPIVALSLFVGSFFLLYFSGLFDVALNHHWAHVAMNAHFLLVGYVFFWPLIGVDPAPKRLPPIGRVGLMFVSVPFHAFFGVILMNSATVIGREFYTNLGLPWVDDLLADQQLGGGMAWALGEIPVLLVLIALMVQWMRTDMREAKRADRRAEANDDAELAAYNAMLHQLAERERHQ